MEDNTNDDLFNAIDDFDTDQVATLLANDPVTPFLVEGEGSVILRAYERIGKAQSLEEVKQARKILFMLLDALARARANNDIEPKRNLGLEETLAKAIYDNAPDLVEALLAAGADPNGRSTLDNQTLLEIAVLKGSLEIVRLLLQWGANPQVFADDGESAFRSMMATGRREIAWLVLLYNALGDAPDELFHALEGGYHDGSIEEAIMKLGLDEAKALRLWGVLLESGCGRGAGAVALGYCQGLGYAPTGKNGGMVITLFLEHSIPDLSGAAITYLMDAGFQFPTVPDTEENLAQTLLCDIIESGGPDALAALFDAGVVPKVQIDAQQRRRCYALELALEHRKSDTLKAILRVIRSEGDLIFATAESLVQHIDTEMLGLFVSCCDFDLDTHLRLMGTAIDNKNAACLAVLAFRPCYPCWDLKDKDIDNQNIQDLLLVRAIATDNIIVPTPVKRFDCARVLLSDPNYDMKKLDDLCQLLIVDRALVSDHAAVYFLCSYGFPPIGLLENFQQIWTDGTIDIATKKALSDSLCVALSGLIYFLDRTVLWNVKALESEALEWILPGSTSLDQRTLIGHLLGWSGAAPDGQDAPDLLVIELLSAISEDDDHPAPEHLQKMLDDVVNALCRTLRHHFSPPSLVNLARDSIVQTGDMNTWNQLRCYLDHIYPTAIWENLQDRDDGYETAIWSLIAFSELQDIEYLAPLIFRPAESSEND